MNCLRITLLASALFTPLLCAATPAHAQATVNGHPADFDQYPSFIEATTHLPNNGEYVLRCGYSTNGTSIAPDAGYMETTALDPSTNRYLRYQRIDNKIIMTTTAPGAAGRFVVQVTEANGTTTAKNCQIDLNTDALQNCMKAQPFSGPADATNQDQTAAQQCGGLFSHATPQLDVRDYNAQKADMFKNSLRQKVVLIEAP